MSEQSESTKSIGRSVSMPVALWEAVDAHAASDPKTGDRSSYITKLVVADLQSVGKWPGCNVGDALAEARDLIEAIGVEAFRERLRAAALAA